MMKYPMNHPCVEVYFDGTMSLAYKDSDEIMARLHVADYESDHGVKVNRPVDIMFRDNPDDDWREFTLN